MHEHFVDGEVFCDDFLDNRINKCLLSESKLIIADCPYGILKDKWDQNITADLYIQWAKKCQEYLTEGGSLYMFGGIGKPKHRIFFNFLSRVEDETDLTLRNLITWKKRRGYGKSDDYLFVREEIAWLIKGNKPLIFNKPYLKEERKTNAFSSLNTKYPPKSKQYRRTNVWTDITELMANLVHPAQKPERLMEVMIETHTNEGDTVLDPFAGSGATALACRKLNRSFVLIEKDEESYRLICDRLK